MNQRRVFPFLTTTFFLAATSGARTPLHGLVLGLEVRDYASPYRLIACRALRRVPFHLNQDGRGFDTELLIQCRALGVVAREVEMNLERDPSFDVARSLWIALGYRAHQLHLTRRGQYFVDRDVRYTLKRHSSSSHKQIIDAVRPGTLVLDADKSVTAVATIAQQHACEGREAS